jgi:hypothetical protein
VLRAIARTVVCALHHEGRSNARREHKPTARIEGRSECKRLETKVSELNRRRVRFKPHKNTLFGHVACDEPIARRADPAQEDTGLAPGAGWIVLFVACDAA